MPSRSIATTTSRLSATYLPLTGGTLTGGLLFSTTNTLDIGTSATVLAPRTVYAGTSFVGPVLTATTSVTIGAGSAITSSGAGGALGTNAFTSTAYAPLASPTFAGTVTAPTATFTNSQAFTLTNAFPQFKAANLTVTVAGGSNAFFYTQPGLMFIGNDAKTSQVVFTQTADGVLELTNAAVTDFGRIQFGGTTSSFPALKRSGTTLAVRLADDSADAPITASTALLSGTGSTSVTSVGIGTANNGFYARTPGSSLDVVINGAAAVAEFYAGGLLTMGGTNGGFFAGVAVTSGDVGILRKGAANWMLGLDAGSSAAAIAQTLSAQGSSGNSAAAALFTIAGSDQSGTTTTGGGLKLRGGNGTTAGGTVEIWTSATTTPAVAVSFGADKTATFAGPIKLANAYVAGVQVPSGYITIQDSTGTTYKISVNL